MHFVRKLIHILKSILICSVISFILVCTSFTSVKSQHQELDLKSAVLISAGFGTALRLLKMDGNNVHNYT
jgi:hypothetical protein